MNLFPRLLLAFFLFFVILVSIVGVSYVVNQHEVANWLSQPSKPGRINEIQNQKIYSIEKGNQSEKVVILPGLSVATVEWWAIQDELSTSHKVLIYDRPGMGWSTATNESLGLEHQQAWLEQLLKERKISETPFTLVAQGVSCLLALEYAQKNPKLIKKLILLTPLPIPALVSQTIDKKWWHIFIDQTETLKRAEWVAKIGFFRFLNMTPYDVPNSIREHVINNLANPQQATTSLREYREYIESAKILSQSVNSNLNVKILKHSSEAHRELLQKYEAPEDVANKVEDAWNEIAQKYANLSSRSQVIESKKGLFALHVEDPKLVVRTILEDDAEKTKK